MRGRLRAATRALAICVGGFLAACSARGGIDRRCDMLEWAADQRGVDSTWSSGAIADSALRAAGVGRMVILLSYRDGSASMARQEINTRLRPAGALHWSFVATSGASADGSVVTAVADARAGEYEWRQSCMGCWPASGRHTFVAGRMDTLRLRVGRARSVCDPPRRSSGARFSAEEVSPDPERGGIG
jgi:hypothetical protein